MAVRPRTRRGGRRRPHRAAGRTAGRRAHRPDLRRLRRSAGRRARDAGRRGARRPADLAGGRLAAGRHGVARPSGRAARRHRRAEQRAALRPRDERAARRPPGRRRGRRPPVPRDPPLVRDAAPGQVDPLPVPGRHREVRRLAAAPARAPPAGARLRRREGRAAGGRLRRPDDGRGAGRAARRGAADRARQVHRGAARRVPGHRPRADRDAARAVRRRAPGHRGRRPVPVDLRVARRQLREHRPVRDDLRARGRTACADLRPRHELPQRRADPARREHGRGAAALPGASVELRPASGAGPG